eukprot:TRINITY_DN17996_c0_g1_i1.p1 TRINITY_DN17996_c0_g1~~TRINITY_DN17996_c0_g1_i1.p1  ORF type:complete len:291 (-),score=70.23 TRINITY_DN17996_c0_g1_i1:84-857(-)
MSKIQHYKFTNLLLKTNFENAELARIHNPKARRHEKAFNPQKTTVTRYFGVTITEALDVLSSSSTPDELFSSLSSQTQNQHNQSSPSSDTEETMLAAARKKRLNKKKRQKMTKKQQQPVETIEKDINSLNVTTTDETESTMNAKNAKNENVEVNVDASKKPSDKLSELVVAKLTAEICYGGHDDRLDLKWLFDRLNEMEKSANIQDNDDFIVIELLQMGKTMFDEDFEVGLLIHNFILETFSENRRKKLYLVVSFFL